MENTSKRLEINSWHGSPVLPGVKIQSTEQAREAHPRDTLHAGRSSLCVDERHATDRPTQIRQVFFRLPCLRPPSSWSKYKFSARHARPVAIREGAPMSPRAGFCAQQQGELSGGDCRCPEAYQVLSSDPGVSCTCLDVDRVSGVVEWRVW